MKGPVIVAGGRVRLARFGAGCIRLARFAARSGPHRFGGPPALNVRRDSQDAHRPHRVPTSSLDGPAPGLWMPALSEPPLVYGLRFSGCRLTYRLVADREIAMLA